MSAEARRILAFVALAAFASHHWFAVLAEFDGWRWALSSAVALAGGIALLLLKGRPRAIRYGGGLAVFIVMLAGGLLAVGIPAERLLPGGWGELQADLVSGLAGVSEIDTPYSGSSLWTRLGIAAAASLALALSMTAAFWPGGSGTIGRATGLGLLVALYATSVTWEAPEGELVRGALLFVAVAAVLWLPRVALPRAVTATAAIVLAVVLALPLASRVDASDPVISYTDWTIFGSEDRLTFNWNHTYGPLDWPQEGTEAFVVTTDRPLYWKTYVLDQFDGRSWTRGAGDFGQFGADYDLSGASTELAAAHPEWVREFDVKLSGLRSRLAVTAGSRVAVQGLELSEVSGDGTTTAERFEIPAGSEYTVQAYVPDPSRRQLRRSDGSFPAGAERYTTLTIPGALSRAEERIGRPAPLRAAVVPLRGERRNQVERLLLAETETIGEIAADTSYGRVLKLSRRLTEGARTQFAAVARIHRYLLSNYDYSQNVDVVQDALPEFLFRDRKGYCQQFSGAMALMLRMSGIPSRVVSGFGPGSAGGEDSYAVRDTDAHSWVEVLFPGIGWVTVDPTPGGAPVRTTIDVPTSATQDDGRGFGLGRAFIERDTPQEGRTERDETASATNDGNGSAVPGLVVLALFGSGAGVAIHRRRRLRSPAGAELQLREIRDALAGIGRAVPAGATLLSVQEALAASAGSDAARYAGALRESRYSRRPRRRPGPAERRAFRWALARSAGPFGWWRALRAVPPGGPRA